MLIAALLGGGVAFVTMRTPSSKPPSKPSASAEAVRSTPARAPAATQAPALRAPTSAATALAPLPSASPNGTAPSENAPPSPSALAQAPASASAAPATSALFAPPTTPEALLESELECDRKKLPEACERVAASLETGSAGTKDAARAQKLRRIALTLYVRQCETDRALSCQRLAEMYEHGEVVQKNPKNAAALRARVIEQCRARPSQLGCEPGK